MQQRSHTLPVTALVIVAATILIVAFVPGLAVRLIDSLLAISNLALFFAVVATLGWFFYWFFLRRMIRARRIANARLRRILSEKIEDEQPEARQ
jgi:flagellar biosynthesis protein FliQ